MGFWVNQDGLPLQFGTQKATTETGGDYVLYGENREIEVLIPLVPMIIGTGNPAVPAPPTAAFSGTGTAIAAGIQSLNTLVPLQGTAINTGGTTITFTATQLFFEQVEIETLIGATGGTSLNIGLVCINPTTGAFVQVTPNAAKQLIDTLVLTTIDTAGKKTTWNSPGTTGIQSGVAANNTLAGGGAWLGNVPLVTNVITPLPTDAYISTLATGTFTNGLIKLRLKYTIYGSINQ